ncbi:MAG: APC family permease [Thermoproteus sp. AZ2]|uniref:APC family permease n=1 Tax=Thermoproteus sp. AZ2 TaxID=1609232 RepID=A0ACC6V116_9CREN
MGQRISFRGLFALALAGILPVGAPLGIAPIIKYAGPASIWPVLLGYLLVLISSLPVLEYARLSPFAGGYYGLAELGLGLFAGKYTALMNYIYYVVWQAQNALLAGWLLTSLLASAYGGGPPAWLWAAAVEGVLILSYLGAVAPPKRYSEDVLFAVLAGSTAFTVALSLYVVAKSHYNSLDYLSPLSAPPGAIALATAVMGFWLYVGYGTPLFYSEEGANPTRDIWRAITLALTLSAAVYALSAYSIIAAVPPSDLAALESAPMPMYYAWSSYLPAPSCWAMPLS